MSTLKISYKAQSTCRNTKNLMHGNQTKGLNCKSLGD